MEFEDSRYALFAEPNAYIQNFDKKEKSETKKIVFQEPYEILPNYHINNDFTKHNCDCVPNGKKKCQDIKTHDCNCKHGDNLNNHCHHNSSNKQNSFGFDLKSLLPLVGLFNNGGYGDIGKLVGLLGNNSNKQSEGGAMNLISSLLSNKEMMSGVLNLFKGGGFNMFSKRNAEKKEIKTTDFEIKNYTRVD